MLGEVISRANFRGTTSLDDAALWPEPRGDGRADGDHRASLGAVATLLKPTVAEIRALAAATRPKLDARGLAMQATAAKIKPLSNFIYRTMQVGVLLIAAGTILGGCLGRLSRGAGSGAGTRRRSGP